MKIRYLVFDKFTGEVYHDSVTKPFFENVEQNMQRHLKLYKGYLDTHPGATLTVMPLGDESQQLNLFH